MSAQAKAPDGRWLLLSGGIGGAKLALGLDRILPRGALTVIANTGDDFRHLGLAISPDLDTLMYTLAGVVNPETGWGRRDETWNAMATLAEIGAETWFRLGDRDLAVHLERTRRLAAGEPLSRITRDLCEKLGIISRIVPMCDTPVETTVVTATGVLPFQQYFVKQRAAPVVTGFRYEGAARALPPQPVLEVLADPALRAILIAPSNPWLSIEPILAVPAIRAAVRVSRAPVIAISPIVAGAAIKGPTAKIMAELGLPVNAVGIARHYREILDGFILDDADAGSIPAVEELGMTALAAATVMRTIGDRSALARCAVGFAERLGENRNRTT